MDVPAILGREERRVGDDSTFWRSSGCTVTHRRRCCISLCRTSFLMNAVLCRALFQNKTTRGQDTKAEGDTLWTSHESAITCMQNASIAGQSFPSSKYPREGAVTRVSTSALDGAIVLWEMPNLEIDFAALQI